MKILALTRYCQLGASSRLRTYQYIPALHALGVDVHVSPLLREIYLQRLYQKQPINYLNLFSDYLKQFIKLFQANSYDLLWIEKELFPNLPAWFEQALSAIGVPYVVDYDDAIFHNYDISPHPLKRLLCNKIDTIMRESVLVCYIKVF